MKIIVITVLLLTQCLSAALAQPGWHDFTQRYFYSIIDVEGKEISFKHNKNYSIMVDSVLYRAPNMPNEPLKQATSSDKGYENQIRINDFSLAIPQKELFFKANDKRLEIKIIHKNDTMYLCQASGTGSYGATIMGLQNQETSRPPADYTLPFKAGHYYFPSWTRDILKKLPETSGNVAFLNAAHLNQSYFIIPGNVYDSSLLYYKSTSERQRVSAEDQYVINNFFLKGHFSLAKRVAPTKNNQLPVEYSWIGKPVATKDKNRFWGMIDYSGSSFSWRTTFFSLNKEENTMELFLPEAEPKLFNCNYRAPYVNVFDSLLYLPVWKKKAFDEHTPAAAYDKLPPEFIVYRSQNEGLTWEKDRKAKAIFDRFDFFEKQGRKIEFIDKGYAVVHYTEITERNEKKNSCKTQGIYYLLKDMQVIDSIKSPAKTSYYANTELLSKEGNLFILGSWTYNYDQTYFELSLAKVKHTWKFQVTEQYYAGLSEQQQSQIPLAEDTIKAYKNFYLIRNRELVFKNGSGKMKLKENATGYSNFIIEKNDQIYLVNDNVVYLSFDGGTNWYLYPASLLPNTFYYLLDINERNEITYFSNEEVGESGRVTCKTFYTFIKE